LAAFLHRRHFELIPARIPAQAASSRSYTAQYNIDRLLWYRQFHEVRHAIAYEKVVKKYSRAKKLTLIRKLNPNGDDLSRDWFKPEWFRGEIAVSRKP
jgi:predicted GIY-YIG superfamily endonuclease